MGKRSAGWVFAVFAALSAAAAGAGGMADATDREALQGGVAGVEWTLVKLVAGGTKQALEGEAVPTLTVEKNGRAGGRATVNRFSGQMEFGAPGQFRWQGPLATTRMAGPEPLMEQEGRFLGALGRATEWHRDGNRLVLSSPGGEDRLEFQR